MTRFLISILFILQLSFNFLISQDNYHAPLGIPLVLSSNFGEIRPNHFHTGLDFKTNGGIGYNIYSIEEGFVSRIKVSPYGYGRVVYIDHPNGKTSVYAHLSSFANRLDSVINLNQKKIKDFEIDVYLEKNEIKVSKGEIIGLSGNTGGSGGPHLHFEIRDTKSEKALNPLLYGFDIADTKKPELRTLKIYGLNKDGYNIHGKVLEYKLILSNGNYKLSNPNITIPNNFCTPSGGIGFAIDGIDRFNGASNQCGIYGTKLLVNDSLIFGQKIEGVLFEESRYVNSHCDYEAYINGRKKYHKLYRNKENPLDIYINKDLGIVKLLGSNKNIKIVAFDAKGNESYIDFKINYDGNLVSNEALEFKEDELIMPDEAYKFDFEKGTIFLSENSVYEPVEKHQKEDAYIHLVKKNVPVQNALSVQIKKSELVLPEEKYYINVKDNAGKNHPLVTSYKDKVFCAESKYFGTFQLFIDTMPPTINTSKLETGLKQKSRILKIPVHDTQNDIIDYDIYIDDQWYALEYETKGDYLTIAVPTEFAGSHKVRFEIKDSCGNILIKELQVIF